MEPVILDRGTSRAKERKRYYRRPPLFFISSRQSGPLFNFLWRINSLYGLVLRQQKLEESETILRRIERSSYFHDRSGLISENVIFFFLFLVLRYVFVYEYAKGNVDVNLARLKLKCGICIRVKN